MRQPKSVLYIVVYRLKAFTLQYCTQRQLQNVERNVYTVYTNKIPYEIKDMTKIGYTIQ